MGIHVSIVVQRETSNQMRFIDIFSKTGLRSLIFYTLVLDLVILKWALMYLVQALAPISNVVGAGSHMLCQESRYPLGATKLISMWNSFNKSRLGHCGYITE